MNINFPLVLVCAVFATGVVILIDKFYLRAKRKPGAKEPVLVDISRSFFSVLLLVLLLRSFIVEPFKIPSASMVPTLLVGDFILVNKYTYGLRLPVTNTKIFSMNEPKRGDVMVFFPPGETRYFIKRVIGLPGDQIRVLNNVLYINGVEMKQDLLQEEPPGNPSYLVMHEDLESDRIHLLRKRLFPTTLGRGDYTYPVVPAGHYFMMGDNRDDSSDSRIWGTVPEENIVGKAVAIWIHWDKFLSLPSFGRNERII